MTTNTVPYWGFYGTQNYFDTNPNDSPDGRAFLDGLRKLDPNAQFVQTTMGDSGSPVWRLQTSVQFPGVDLNSGAYNPQYDPNDTTGSHNFDTSQLKDPSAVQQSGTFGAYTPWSNLKPQAPTMLDYLGPAAVGAFGLLMGGIPAAYQGIFGQGQFGGGAFDPSLSIGNPMAPYDPGYGTMQPFNPSDADIGLGGSANAPLGSAESSLYGQGALTDPGQALGGSFDPNLDVTGGYKLPMTPGYDQMSPFNPASPEYGQFAINPDGSPVPQLSTGSSGLGNILSKIPQAISALGQIPGLGGGSGTGGGSGGSGGLLQPYNMQPYKSLVAAIRNFGLLGQPNG